MKRVVIVHCWEGYPNYCWYPQVKQDLEKKGFKVDVPAMPETNLPKLVQWLPKLKEVIGEPSENLYLVGHSLGVITILRYLESLNLNKKVGGCVFVAGFTNDLGYKELRNFFQVPIGFAEVIKHCSKFIAIHSDNDPYVDLEFGNEFKDKLNARLVIKHAMGHFSGPVDDEKSCRLLPDVTKSIFALG